MIRIHLIRLIFKTEGKIFISQTIVTSTCKNSFVFVASPVCVDKYIELRLLWIRQAVWNPNSWLGFGTKTFVATTGILC